MIGLLTEWIGRFGALRGRLRLESADTSHIRQVVEEYLVQAEGKLLGGNHDAAKELWDSARTQYPDIVPESRRGLSLLLRLGAFQTAEELMKEGRKRFSRNPFFLEGAALAEERRGNDNHAVALYADLRRKFPSYRLGYIAAVPILIKLGRLDEADKVLSRIANDPDVGVEFARLAMLRKDWQAAYRRWREIQHLRREAAALGMAQCCRELGRYEEAERIIKEMFRLPQRIDMMVFWRELVALSEAKGDWHEAARLWSDIRLSSPSTLDAYRLGAEALKKCGRHSEAEKVLREGEMRFPNAITTVSVPE